MGDFFAKLFDTGDFPARWHCGQWTPGHGWTHIVSDGAIFGAYMAIPFLLAYALRRRRDVPRPLPRILMLFIAFVACCGVTHLVEAILFWEPIYRFAAVAKVATALVSWSTVLALAPALPILLALRTPNELAREVADKTDALRRERDAATALAAIVRSSQDGIVSVDLDGVVRSWNPAAEHIFGMTADEATGRTFDAALPSAYRAHLTGMLTQLRSGQQPPQLQMQRELPGGGRIVAALSLSPLHAADGRLSGASVIARDVTQRQQAEETLQATEARLRDLYDNSPDMYATIDLTTGELTLANLTMYRTLGYGPGELVGRHVEEVHTPTCRPALRTALETLRDTGEAPDVSLVLRDRGSRDLNVSLSLSAMRNRQGEITSARAAWRDVTERIRAQELFERAVEASPSGMIVVDDAGEIVLANAEVEDLFGYTKAEILGRSVETLVPDETRAEHPRMRAGYLQAPQKRTMSERKELFARRKDGSLFPVEVGLNPIEMDGKTLVLGAIVDLSDLVENQRQLRRHMQALQRSNAELEQFAYVASHDLQEPLRMVSSFSQLLARRYQGKLDPQADEYIRYLVEGARRMQGMIQDLLNYSRVTRSSVARKRVNSTHIIEQVLDSLRIAIDESQAEVLCSELPWVYADPAQLVQIFQNLISNAIKFRRGKAPRVEIACEQVEESWRFSVSDNGIGLDHEQKDRIFEMFQRLHERESYPGNGIGLAVVKKLVEGHGGRVSVVSTPGEGSTFFFTLPVSPESVTPPR